MLSLFREGKLILNERERSLYHVSSIRICAVYMFRVSRELLTRTVRYNITCIWSRESGKQRVETYPPPLVRKLLFVYYYVLQYRVITN